MAYVQKKLMDHYDGYETLQQYTIHIINEFGGIDYFKETLNNMKKHVHPETKSIINTMCIYYDLVFKIEMNIENDVRDHVDQVEKTKKHMIHHQKNHHVAKFWLHLLDETYDYIKSHHTLKIV